MNYVVGKKEVILDNFEDIDISRLKTAIKKKDPMLVVMETDLFLKNILMENLLTKKVIKNIVKGHAEVNTDEMMDKIRSMPLWRLLIDAYVNNVIDRDQFRKINKLRKSSNEYIKNYKASDKEIKLKKEFYNEWLKVLNGLIKQNRILTNEFEKVGF